MRLAALWVHENRQRTAERLDGRSPAAADLIERCPDCAGPACERCGGLGVIDRERPGDDLDVEGIEDFLRAWSLVERYGVSGWLQLEHPDGAEPSEAFVDALLVFSGELDRLEIETRAREAEQRRLRGDKR